MKLFKITFEIECSGECLVLAENAELAKDAFISRIKESNFSPDICSVDEISLRESAVFWFDSGLFA